MKLKLKEDPREWFKFTAVMALAAVIVTALLIRAKVLPVAGLLVVGLALSQTLMICWMRPRFFRGFYRLGMTMSFRVGQTLGFVWLTIFFLLILTPLGLLLRLLGKDLLALKRRKTASYWQAARPPGPFTRQF